ncbi:hypothetical protein [Leucobacter manosquensis]|uniref:ABC transporter n=1 Tax=Leucobacter manosquensis TaxID=2810611 RepID=A0ABS5M833_9MICO|nr:hypothetical protein [Leucobacter manosquensis]MBS3183358.1 hypothetical protein [Leucobacter manosquensis]
MSDEREGSASRAAETPETAGNPGAPVEETEASRTEVLRAVQRSRTSSTDEGAGEQHVSTQTDVVAREAGEPESTPGVEEDAERARREQASLVDTQLDMEPPTERAASSATLTREETAALPALDDLPTAADESTTRERDGEIRISSDHPMAGLYVQTPMPPDIKGNRGAGVLIAILATVGFAAVLAGVLALWLAPMFPPSSFLTDGLVPWLTSWPVIAGAVAFFVGLVLLVLIAGRAGWWAYVLGGFFVAALVWAAVTLGLAYFGTPFESPREMLGGTRGWSGDLHTLVTRFGLTVPALGAALVAREVTVWFGAWIGGRGRRMKQRNARELADYEASLAESKASAQA